MSFSGDQTQLGDCPITSGGDQASCFGQTMTPNADPTCHGHQEMALSGDQNDLLDEMIAFLSDELLPNGAQTMAPNTNETFFGGQTTFPIGNQTFFGGQMTPTSNLTNGVQMTFPNGNQTFWGDQMTTPSGHQTGNQALYRSENITPSVDQTIYGNHTLYGAQMAIQDGDQTLHGLQMTNPSGDQTFYNHQRANLYGDQTFYDPQKTNLNGDQTQMSNMNGDQTYYDPQKTNLNGDQSFYYPQMTNPSGGLTHYTGQVMSLVGSQMPFQDRSPTISNSALIQKQLPKCSSSFSLAQRNHPDVKVDLSTPDPKLKKKKNLKSYKCQICGQKFQKSSHIRSHIRKHTGR
ncbi:hypothetical protein ACRRTK_016753 [Alexandromys fortis]